MKFFRAGQASIEAALWCTTIMMIAYFGKIIFIKYHGKTSTIRLVTEKQLLHKPLTLRDKQWILTP
ncbi:MAG: hypothetical protein A2X86_18665 [Bdellovibrionales bacterium GWA2_49_15]|nr:MAG: hypothetical protein A2X86_18665 [Bdellovibrionales bacterium GWA2_49_15]HAZ14250.1 hypothetical protein [Bdellovibrionales bacterium]